MNIETTDDLLNHFADLIGCYGACKSCDDIGHEVDCTNESTTCCRVGFMIEYKDRMIQAVENDKIIGLISPNDKKQ